MTVRAGALLLAMLWLPAAWAEETRRIALPHAALSFQPEPGWELAQFDGAVLELRKDGARLWAYGGQRGSEASKRVKRYAERVGGESARVEPWNIRGIRDASRVWHDANEEHRMLGALTRDDDTSLDVEALVPQGQAALVAEVRKICDSFDANPFVHPERVVHWSQGWTLDLAEHWLVGASQEGLVHLTRPDLGGFDGYVGKAGAISRLKRQSRFRDFEFISVRMPHGVATGTEELFRLGSKKKGGADLLFWQRSVDGLEAALIYPTPDDEGAKSADDAPKAMLRTLRNGTDPGPQRDVAQERFPTRFPRADGPPLTFRFPMSWRMSKPTSGMRLAQFQTAGTASLSGVVYWFGDGKGGTVAQNMARWIGQFETEAAPADPEPIAVADGIRATTLDISGTYVASVRPGSPDKVNQPDQRMLGTVLEVPQGPVFIKLVGDRQAVDKAADAYHAWLKSFRVSKSAAGK